VRVCMSVRVSVHVSVCVCVHVRAPDKATHLLRAYVPQSAVC